MALRLIRLTKEYEQQLGEMIDEWKADQEINHTDRSPWAIFKNDYHDFDYYLEHLEHKTETADRVPDSVFFLLDEDRNRLLGAVNIRHSLNESLLRDGGHIGDGIRPSERRKGYATEMIRLALLECRKLGIDRVLMICGKDNLGSARSIQNNGGVLENETVNSDGKVIQRYWIENGNRNDEQICIQKKESSKMRYLVISDIHGSRSSAAAVEELLERHACTKIISLGDVLYHGPRNDLPADYAPKEVIALLNPLADQIIGVRGNCDAEVDQMVLKFDVHSDDQRIHFGDHLVYITHGHLELEKRIVLECGNIVLRGHTHIPVCEVKDGVIFLNPGSMTLPKENHPRSYGILEEDRFSVMKLEDHSVFMHMQF